MLIIIGRTLNVRSHRFLVCCNSILNDIIINLKILGNHCKTIFNILFKSVKFNKKYAKHEKRIHTNKNVVYLVKYTQFKFLYFNQKIFLK